MDGKAYTKAIENSVKLMEYKGTYGTLEFRKNFKELSEDFQTKITNSAKKHQENEQIKEECIQQQKGMVW